MATRTSSANAVTANDRGRGDRVVTSNRRAFHDFHILESVEAGIVLTGTEIKSIRDGKATIAEAYARFENGELWLIGSNVAPYSHGNRANHESDRPRKLLVHRRELERLRTAVEQKGLTLVPLRLHLKKGWPSSTSASREARSSTTSEPPTRTGRRDATWSEPYEAGSSSRHGSRDRCSCTSC